MSLEHRPKPRPDARKSENGFGAVLAVFFVILIVTAPATICAHVRAREIEGDIERYRSQVATLKGDVIQLREKLAHARNRFEGQLDDLAKAFDSRADELAADNEFQDGRLDKIEYLDKLFAATDAAEFKATERNTKNIAALYKWANSFYPPEKPCRK